MRPETGVQGRLLRFACVVAADPVSAIVPGWPARTNALSAILRFEEFPIVAVDALQDVRSRLLPMLQTAAQQYQNRVPSGYPVVTDSPESGTIGLEIDPSHALYIVEDGEELSARMYRRAPRTDSRSSSGRQKYGGAPFSDARPLSTDVSDHELRNLIAELMSWYNTQPGLLYITDE